MVEKSISNVSLDDIMPIIREQLAAGERVKFSPRGISMLPMLRPETDSVVLSPLPQTLKKYDLPLYRRQDGSYILHRIIEVGETYTCMGDNQFTKEPGIRKEQMIALVTGFYRNRRFHSVEEPLYRFYCKFWYYSRPLRHFWHRGIGFLRRKLP